MIINIWKPIYSKKNNVRTIKYYEIVEDYRDLKKGWQVIYKCDLCLSNKNHHTTTSVLLNTNVRYNTLQSQTCRSCRSSISEGFKNCVLPYIIGGVKNLEIIDGFENNSKGVKCSIKFEELI